MSMRSCTSPSLTAALFILTTAIGSATAPDLSSGFNADTEGWRASDVGATLTWQATGGANGAYLQGEGPAPDVGWYLLSPLAWAGDFSEYQVLKFDLAIPSRHYADDDLGDIVVIVGANAETMTWNGPTPMWTWTHFEISLDPQSFDVDQATFDGIMANVAEIRILAEFTTASETIGLDNVLLTATPATVHSENLVERFTLATVDPLDNSVAGWSPVDDVTFYVADEGRPSRCLHGDDWQDGRLFKIASPEEWAGDWSAFTELSFDFKWDSSSGTGGDQFVQIFGANGHILTWSTTLYDELWQHHTIPLTPATFGVDQATFDGVMAYVNQLWIKGEYDSGNDQAYLDNVVLSTGPVTPTPFQTNLVSRFGADDEGWSPLNNCALTWIADGGVTGGYISGQDTGSGLAKLQSPDSWAGDWSSFSELRLFQKTLGRNQGTVDTQVWIVTWDGTALTATFPPPYRSWSPYTVDLVPETFGVTQEEFAAIIGDVACLWVLSDLAGVTGASDNNGLDEVSLVIDGSATVPPPEHLSEFVAHDEAWRGDGWTGSSWTFATSPAEHIADGGNPDGCVALTDVEDLAAWLSPEGWAGDWRGYQSVAFDIKIITGTNLLEPGWMLSIVSSHGNLFQDCVEVPVPQEWKHYEFPLTPAAFGVTQEEFDLKMRDVIALAIRSEWIYGSEKEALDNVTVSAVPDAYWSWLAGYLTPGQLGDDSIAGKSADADHDRFTNWDEFVALTVPTDPLSNFRVPIVPQVFGGFSVEYLSRNGRVYQVWKTTNPIDPGSWVPVGPEETGDDTMKSYMDPGTEPAAFFRVGVEIP